MKTLEETIRDKILYIGEEVPEFFVEDKRPKFIVLGSPQELMDEVEQAEINATCKTCGIKFHDCSKRAIYCPEHSIANKHSTERSRAWKLKNAEHYKEHQRQYEIKRNLI